MELWFTLEKTKVLLKNLWYSGKNYGTHVLYDTIPSTYEAKKNHDRLPMIMKLRFIMGKNFGNNRSFGTNI